RRFSRAGCQRLPLWWITDMVEHLDLHPLLRHPCRSQKASDSIQVAWWSTQHIFCRWKFMDKRVHVGLRQATIPSSLSGGEAHVGESTAGLAQLGERHELSLSVR